MINLFLTALSENPLLMTTGNSNHITRTAECVLKLSAKYFVEKKALSGSIVIININSYSSVTQGLLLQTIHDGTKYSVMVKDSFYQHANASHFPEKAKNYMLILEERSELKRNIMQLNKLPTWNPLAKAIVLYQLDENELGPVVAVDFINTLREFKLLNTIVLVYDEFAKEVISYTWKPYSDKNCGGFCSAVHVIDVCKNGIIHELVEQSEFIPLNMKGCPLVTYAVISEPYVMPPKKKIILSRFNDAYEFSKGGEINLVKIITQFTNMSMIVRMSQKEENWGTVYADGTASGAYGELMNDSSDLAIGNIEVTKTIRKLFHPTISYTQDEMTWCVPKAKKSANWENLINIFQWSVWTVTLISLIVTGVIFHYFYYKENLKIATKWPTKSLLMTLSMLLGWGARFQPKSTTFRILIFCWLCFSLNMGICYDSFLRSFLMHPRFEKQINNEADLILSGIPLGGRAIYRSYFETNNASSFYLYRKYNSTTFSEGIRRAALRRDFAVVSSRRQAEYYDQVLGKGEPLLYCFMEKNNLYKYGVVLLARKWFPLLDRFNSIIRRVVENGLINKWNDEMIIHKVSEVEIGVIVPLSINHMKGAFMFLGFMYVIGTVVFLGELVCDFMKRQRRIRWTCF